MEAGRRDRFADTGDRGDKSTSRGYAFRWGVRVRGSLFVQARQPDSLTVDSHRNNKTAHRSDRCAVLLSTVLLSSCPAVHWTLCTVNCSLATGWPPSRQRDRAVLRRAVLRDHELRRRGAVVRDHLATV